MTSWKAWLVEDLMEGVLRGFLPSFDSWVYAGIISLTILEQPIHQSRFHLN